MDRSTFHRGPRAGGTAGLVLPAGSRSLLEHEIESLTALSGLCETRCMALGYDRFCLAVRLWPAGPAPFNFVFSNYPGDWLGELFRPGHFSAPAAGLDPFHQVRPLGWHQADSLQSGVGDFLHRQWRQHGLHGILAPKPGPDGAYCLLLASRGAPSSGGDGASEEELGSALLLISQMMERLLRLFFHPADRRPVTLTRRQGEILRRIASGEPIKQIAVALGIEPSTVRYLLARCVRKLGVETREAALARAVSLGLLQTGSESIPGG